MDKVEQNHTFDSTPEAILKSEAPPMLPNYLTPPRIEILDWLRRNGGDSLADFYEATIRLISDVAFPARFRLIGHSVREIRNRLPDVIAGRMRGGRLDYVSPMDAIAKEWERAGFGQDGSLPISDRASQTSSTAQPGITIPVKLYGRIGSFINAHLTARDKKSDAAIRLFKACDTNNRHGETLNPVISQWLDVTEWFMRKTHDSGEDPSSFDEQELQDKFQIFEASLRGLSRGFYSTLDELDEILEDTNS